MGSFDSLGADIATALNDAEVTTNVTHTSVSQGAMDPATSTAVVTTTNYTIKGVPSACRKEIKSGVKVEAGDVKLTVMAPAFTVAPTTADKFTVRSIVYGVVALVWSEIGGALVSYTFQLRKA